MKNLRVPLIVACLCVAVAASSAPADGFKWGDLNPFNNGQKKDDGVRRFRPAKKNNSFLPQFSLSPKPKRPGQPGPIQKFSRGTQQFFAKTADFLNPFNDGNKMPTTRPNVTGSRGFRSGGTSYSSREEKKKKNFFERLVSWEKEESQPAGTMAEWIGQDRPRIR